jgi:hypothetical protein
MARGGCTGPGGRRGPGEGLTNDQWRVAIRQRTKRAPPQMCFYAIASGCRCGYFMTNSQAKKRRPRRETRAEDKGSLRWASYLASTVIPPARRGAEGPTGQELRSATPQRPSKAVLSFAMSTEARLPPSTEARLLLPADGRSAGSAGPLVPKAPWKGKKKSARSTPTTSTLTEHTALPRHRRHPPPQHTAL